jgi:hypothetical protein
MSNGLFDNLRALFTSLGSSERQELEELWEQNGGKVVATVTPNDPPHVMITRRVGSAKYVSLMRRHPNTHVVPPEWIRKSVEMKKKQPYSQVCIRMCYAVSPPAAALLDPLTRAPRSFNFLPVSGEMSIWPEDMSLRI